MAFPQTPLPVGTALWLGGQWVDITADTRLSRAHSGGGITIASRGVPNEGGRRADPASASLTINNRSGHYSARNPRSTYYGQLRQATPLRVTVNGGGSYLHLRDGQRTYTPDHSSLDITGDIDVRIDLTPNTWKLTGLYQVLVSKWNSAIDHRSWVLMLNPDGRPYWAWSATGAGGGAIMAYTGTTAVPQQAGRRLALRATLDVNNGTGGRTVTFYTAETLAGPWTQLGSPGVNNTATTSIYSGSAAVEIGTADTGNTPFSLTQRLAGRVHGVEVRSGIGGTVVADYDGTATPGTGSWTDGAGRPWTLTGPAEVVATGTRALLAVSEWPPRWDLSGHDRWTPIEAAGILQQLGQGESPLYSPLRRHWGAVTPASGYWPFEDGTDATSGASAVAGVGAADALEVEFAADDTLPGAAPVAKLSAATSRVGATGAPTPPDTTAWAIAWCFKLPAVPAGTTPLMTIHCAGGTVARWEVSTTATAYQAQGYDAAGTLVASDLGTHGAQTPDQWIAMHFGVEQVGGNVSFAIFFSVVGSGQFFAITDTYAGTTGRALRWDLRGSTGYTGGSLAHVLLVPSTMSFVDRDLAAAAAGYVDETAGARALRLAAEEGVTLDVIGDWITSARMGRQTTKMFVELLQECVDADRGYLGEARDVYGLRIRCRTSLYNQTPLTLDYSAGHISPPFEPTDDDQQIRNDVTVSRTGGSSARSVQETGPLNIRSPRDDPEGVGPYTDTPTINVAADAQLPHLAAWLRSLGTVDEARYKQIRADLSAAAWAADPALTAAAADIDTGDLLALTGLPNWLPPGPIEQLAIGYAEFIDAYDWDLTWNAVPGSPYRVGIAGTTTRVDTGGSVLAADFVAGVDTEMVVASVVGHFEHFERADLGLDWTSGGNAPWTRDSTEAHSGTWSLRSGAIASDQTSEAIVAVPDGARSMSFWYKVSSEEAFDYLTVLADGDVVLDETGEVDWTRLDLDVRDVDTITFRYSKDEALTGGSDAAWIDDLAFYAPSEPRLWIQTATKPAHFPVDVTTGGVRSTVTACVGAQSPQVFTVDQTPVNGIERTVPAGTPVRLADPWRLAL